MDQSLGIFAQHSGLGEIPNLETFILVVTPDCVIEGWGL